VAECPDPSLLARLRAPTFGDPRSIVMVAIDIALASILMDSGLRRNDGNVPFIVIQNKFLNGWFVPRLCENPKNWRW